MVEPSDGPENTTDFSRAPRNGVRLMIVILIGLALVAIYANVQKSRHDQVESVTLYPFPTATPAQTPDR